MYEENGECICKDQRTGEIISKYKKDKLPNGNSPEFFKKYEAKLLKDFPQENIYKGDNVYANMVPSGEWYLEKSGLTFNSNAKQGEDFIIII